MIKIVHTDDDAQFLNFFKNLVKDIPGIRYLGSFENADDTYNYVSHNEVDLLFLDVEMPGHNGLWLAEQLKENLAEIIFVTSHTGYAVSAFEACAIDYIIKPTGREDIVAVIERYRKKKKKSLKIMWEQVVELYGNYINDSSLPQRVFINNVGETVIVPLKDVMYFISLDNYTEIYLADGTKHISSKNLKLYNDILKRNNEFLRIHRSSIVNKNFAKSIIKDSKRHRVTVVMQDRKELEISYLKRDILIQALTL